MSRCLTLALGLCAVVSLDVHAQQSSDVPGNAGGGNAEERTVSVGPWSVLDAIGYGGIGASVGLLVGFLCDFEHPRSAWANHIPMMGGAVGALGGALGAFVIGHRAEARLARGEPLGGSHRNAVAAGPIVGGAALGALATIALLSGDSYRTPEEEARTAKVLILGGAALGTLSVLSQWPTLVTRGVVISPAIRGPRDYGIQIRAAF